MIIWFFISPWWFLPLGGFFIGYATNWLALQLIFRPLEPKRFLGMTIQGMFVKRQKEVSDEYSKVVASKLLSTQNIFDTIIHGPSSDKLMNILEKHVKNGVDKTAGLSRPIIRVTSGSEKYERIKAIACNRILDELPNSVKYTFDYADKALDMENTLSSRMKSLPSREFEGFLRPVFQEDEWKLILIGAVLGALAGCCQLLLHIDKI